MNICKPIKVEVMLAESQNNRQRVCVCPHTDFWLSSPSRALAQEEELDAKRRQVKRHTHGPFYSEAFNKGQLTL